MVILVTTKLRLTLTEFHICDLKELDERTLFMLVDKINAYLSGKGQDIPSAILEEVGKLSSQAFSRQFGERIKKKGTLRLSSIGHCLRQQGYNILEFPVAGKEIDSRARMVFFMGDVVEIAIIQLAKVVGCPITDRQQDVAIDGIEGHPDGIVGDHLLEVKSMSSFAFAEFQKGFIDEGYRYQVNAYMHALGLSKAVIVALNKDAGVLHELIISKDAAIVEDIQGRIARLKASTKENLPPRQFSANEKGFLPWNCLYCAYWQTCWPTAEKVLVQHKSKLKLKEEIHATA